METKKKSRVFLGQEDPEAVIVYRPFANSPIVISSGIHLHEDKNGIAIEGPKEHLEFLYPKLAKLLLSYAEVDEKSGVGKWIGLGWLNDEWLSFFYLFGRSFADVFELLEYKLRRDLVFFCNLKLNEEAELVVRHNNKVVFHINTLGLPEGITENGFIEFPSLFENLVKPVLLD